MTGLSVLYANQAMKERGWADVPDRNKVSRLREMYWLKGVKPLRPQVQSENAIVLATRPRGT